MSGQLDSSAFDAIVVGSGFGGSIAALRLAEAGADVLVLERGKRYRSGAFPRDVRNTDELLWRYPKSRGLYELRFFKGLATVTASGLGGGSLIYANIHIRPDESVFADPRWPDGTDRAALDPYYDRVAAELGVAPLPAALEVPKRAAFHAAGAGLGRRVFDPDQAVAWENACQLVAECEFGCPHAAKNSVDRTYLARAEEHGARIRTDTLVESVEASGDGGYRVHCQDLARGAPIRFDARKLVLSAGTLGTNELLLRSRDVERTLEGLSDRLGVGYSANGDFLGSIQSSAQDLDPWHGPDVTSVMEWHDEEPHFTLAAPTFDRQVMAVLTALGQGKGRLCRPLAGLLWPLFGRLVPVALRLGLLSRPLNLPWRRSHDPDRTTFLFAIGQDDAGGRLHARGGRLALDWDYADRNRALVDRMTAAMEDMGKQYGGTVAPLFSWLLFRRIITVHSLGGCAISVSPADGVVSPRGEVHGHPGLYVADGSVVPTSIGYHPAMTICALAERTAEHAARS